MSELYPSSEYKLTQRELLEKLLQPQPTVVALEGGPCSGKSTLLAEIERQSETIDRPVVIIKEVATPKISEWEEKTGKKIPELAANDRPEYLRFQQGVLEGIVTEIETKKAECEGTNAVIIIDRCDIGAYVNPYEHGVLLRNIGKEASPLYEYADRVYYLPSVAREDPGKYAVLKSTNGQRYEEADAAIATCEANLYAVSAHPELHVSWGGDFTEKIQRIAQNILQPELEGEIKQVVLPAEAAEIVENSDVLYVHEIAQSYHVLDGQEFRLRAHLNTPTRHRYVTIKQGEGAVRTEIQRRITESEYDFLYKVPRLGNELRKGRYVLLDSVVESNGQRRLWNADTYERPNIPQWHFETDIETELEADELSLLYKGVRRRTAISARDLIYME